MITGRSRVGARLQSGEKVKAVFRGERPNEGKEYTFVQGSKFKDSTRKTLKKLASSKKLKAPHLEH